MIFQVKTSKSYLNCLSNKKIFMLYEYKVVYTNKWLSSALFLLLKKKSHAYCSTEITLN